MKTHLKHLRKVAVAATKPRKFNSCTATNCTCNEMAVAKKNFYDAAHPLMIIWMVDQLEKLNGTTESGETN